MNTLLAVLQAPIEAGLLPANLALAVALILVKLYDAWSTIYILGHGGRETNPLVSFWMERLHSVGGGIAVDFALVVACAWIMYPIWWLLAGVLAWYGYWMALQVDEVRKTKNQQ